MNDPEIPEPEIKKQANRKKEIAEMIYITFITAIVLFVAILAL